MQLISELRPPYRLMKETVNSDEIQMDHECTEKDSKHRPCQKRSKPQSCHGRMAIASREDDLEEDYNPYYLQSDRGLCAIFLP